MEYRFKSSLKQGQAGEERIQVRFPLWERTDGRIADFIMPGGRKIEVKTESRTTQQTPNLALELTSSPGRPGAIERAVTDNIDFILYLYADDELFCYSPVELLEYMRQNITKHRVIKVKNIGYESTVLLVPRDAVKHLLLELK